MDLGLSGKSALVWGGSKGMGYAAARRLALEGADVVIAARTEATLQGAAQALSQDCGRTVRYVVADITRNAGREAALAACPQPDILVNNSDGYPPGDFREWTQETWHEALDMMMIGPIDMIRRVVDGMQERRYGRIINITSVVGASGNPGQANYAAAKAGVAGMTRALARELGSRNITVNCVAPGFIATDMTQAMGEGAIDALQSQIPLARLGQAQDIANAVLFLASSQADYITGQVLGVNGGMDM